MASKVLVPTSPFSKLQLKKTPPDGVGVGGVLGGPGGGGIGGEAAARVAHLEHSVRFLQEQHRAMLAGLHAELEALRERNRDLQFQLIFNKESSPKASSPANEESGDASEVSRLRGEVAAARSEAAAARSEARAAEARALQLQRLVDQQAEKIRELELRTQSVSAEEQLSGEGESAESRAQLRARLGDAERLVRRLRADGERQRRELQCMRSSLQASLRGAGALDAGFGFHNSYHFPPAPLPDFWREPHRDEFGARRGARRPALPELAGPPAHRATIYANQHTRGARGAAHEGRRKPLAANGETLAGKSPDDSPERARLKTIHATDLMKPCARLRARRDSYPELKVVVTKLISHEYATGAGKCEGGVRRVRRARRAPDT